MRSLPQEPVFTRSNARDLGWTDSALTRALRSGRLVQLRHGQLALPSDGDGLLELAAARDCAGSVVSHRSALVLHGLPIVGTPALLPELTVAPRGTGSLHRAHLHRATLPAQHVDQVGGVPVTTVARTLVDVARSRPTATAVAAIDAALNRGLVTEGDVDDIVLACWNWPGIRRAQRSLALVDGRSESPLESVSRLVIHWLRLPPPQLQRVARDEHGRFLGRLDFYWDEFGVAGEADGRSKYDERQVLTDEKDRQEDLEDEGMVFARWGWKLATRRPHALRDKLLRAFERGHRRDRSGLRRTWSISPQ